MKTTLGAAPAAIKIANYGIWCRTEDSAMSAMCFGDSCKSADHSEIAVIRLWMDLVVIEMDLTWLS